MDSIKNILEKSIELNAKRIFTVFRNPLDGKFIDWSYGDLAQASRSIQTFLAEHTQTTTALPILMRSRGLAYASLLTSAVGGHCAVPLSLKRSDEGLITILQGLRATILLTDEFCYQRSLQIQKSLPFLNIFNVENSSWVKAQVGTQCPTFNDTAYILYTSGSTGSPKGVEVSSANLVTLLSDMKKIFSHGADDKFTQGYELSFDLALGEIFWAMSLGASLYPYEASELPLIKQYLERVAPTVWSSTPSTIQFIASNDLLKNFNFPSIRQSLFCGEVLKNHVAEAWSNWAPNSAIYNLYGPTEATVYVSYHQWQKSHFRSPYGVSIGQAFPSSVVRIENDQGHPLPAHQIGEIVIKGPQVAVGYVNGAKFLSYYKTGDLGLYDEAGQMYFCGRKDLQVKVSGYRIELEEIEFHAHNAIPGANFMALSMQINEMQTLILVTATLLTESQSTHLKNSLRFHLPIYSLPQQILFLKEWPLNMHLKTDRRAVERLILNKDSYIRL